MDSQSFSKIWIIVILIVIIAGSILAWQYFRVPKEEIPQTANWKVYRNEQYGLEVKYPENWVTKESVLGEMKIAAEIGKFSDDLGITIYMNPNPAGKTVKELLTEVSIPTATILEQNSTFIGNEIQGLLVKLRDGAQRICFRNNHDIFEVIVKANYVDYTDQILSTLRFTEERGFVITSPAQGDGWKEGETYQIQWRPENPKETVGIMLSDTRYPSPSLRKVWQKENITNTGGYSFTIPVGLTPGTEYQIYIDSKVDYGYSGLFSIAPSEKTFQNPVIDEIVGPVQLVVGEQGTWIIKAHDPQGGGLSNYTASWGDKSSCTSESCGPKGDFSFTHFYSEAGIFKATFGVSNPQDLRGFKSIEITVIGE